MNQNNESDQSRRDFLKKAAALSAAALTVGMSPVEAQAFFDFFRKHYSEMSPEAKAKLLARLKQQIDKEYATDINLKDPQAVPGAHFVYCLNLSKCNGSRKCVTACMKENNQHRDTAMSYIKVVEMDIGTLNMEKGNHFYEGMVPKEGKFYLPIQCNQCDNPPCVKSCPVKATWKESDGIVVVDSEWCIGCRYCMAACPYEARRFNFQKPEIPEGEINLNQAYLGNKIRPKGVVEKCTFCLQRTREGGYPACVEACPTGSRKFGNLKDPNSEVAKIFKEKRVFVLKEELNTKPRFFYYFD